MNSRLRTYLLYAGMLALAALLLLLILTAGRGLQSPSPTVDTAGTTAVLGSDALLHVLIALAAILVLGRFLSWLFRFINQPPVIGEVVAGILIGPTFLGRFWPDAGQFILPAKVAPYLGIVSQVGIILYMFVVGLELNPAALRKQAQTTVAISHASIVLPFLLGAALALPLYPRFTQGDVRFVPFALFVGVSMSITAFPVLARILKDKGIQSTDLGILALACAATDDVTAWCLLAFVVGTAQENLAGAATTLGLTIAYVTLLVFLVRPFVQRYLAKENNRPLTQATVTAALIGVLLSAVATEAIGVHSLFGAFLMGAIIPHDSSVARALITKLEDLVTILFLPAFFAYTGMRTRIGVVWGAEQWVFCGLIILVASAGKFGGTLIAGRLTGLKWRKASALGLLMNTRGLMELIALNIGLDMKIISPDLFAAMVVMALATTMATSPLLRFVQPDLQQGPAQNQDGGAEIDDQAGHVHERGDKGR